MKTPARKPISPPQHFEKTPTADSAGRQASLTRLQFCFFLSGAAGLIDQVLWTKALGLLFGYSAYAVATVLAVFMGGLALGSALFARWRPAKLRGAALYAWLEFAIAGSALLSLPGIALVRHVYLATYPHAGGSFLFLMILRFLGAAVVLTVPTILMGGTLPVLLGGVAREANELGIRAARFYAMNTAGAVAGTVAAGFFLIPWLGLRLTLVAAAALNLIAGLLSRGIARRLTTAETTAAHKANAVCAQASTFYFAAFALVGATAIAYELAWTRLLATPLGSSTYAFSLMLATFLLGIAIGSAVFERWHGRRRVATASLFAKTQLAIAAAVLFSLWVYREIPEMLLFFLRIFGERFSALLTAQIAACVLALLPATMLFGFNFPLVLALIAGSDGRNVAGGEDFSESVGHTAAVNTAGAICASIAGGFFLLPWLGGFRLVALAACVNVTLGVVLFLRANVRNWKAILVATALLVAIGWSAGSSLFFSQASAAYGVVLYGNFHNAALTAREMADTEDIAFFKDGINATIAVARSENYVALKTNGKVDASNLDSSTQLLLGYLGAVFHTGPRKVLIIGFGGGMTASAVSRFPEVQRIDCVEIEPAVVEAAPYLERLNRGVLNDPRLHLNFDDARNFLQTSREQYDLIISEPSTPWIAGIPSLYTDEFFAVVHAHLAPGGNFVQWIQAYGLKLDDFAMILGGLDRQFPDLTLWHSSGRDFLVLARTTTEPLSFDHSRALWNKDLLREDFATLHLTRPESWTAYFRLDRSEIHLLLNRAFSNTDDRTLLEYSAPKNLLNDSLTGELELAIAAIEKSPLPNNLSARDAKLAPIASAETALDDNKPNRAQRIMSLLPESKADQSEQVVRARIEMANQQFSQAEHRLKTVSGDNQYDALYWLAIAQRRSGRLLDAETTVLELLQRQPDHSLALECKVGLASERKNWQQAAEAQRNLAAIHPDSSSEQCRLGDLQLRGGDKVGARSSLLKGLQLDPYAFLCHRDLGELERAEGRITDAVRELEWVVRYFPEGDPKTYVSLALAYQKAGKNADAQQALEMRKRVFASDPLLQKFSLKTN